MKMSKKFSMTMFMFLILILISPINAMHWEVGIRVTSGGQAISVPIVIYVFNSATRNYDYYDGGWSTTSLLSFPEGCNAAFDIADQTADTDNPTIAMLPAMDFILKINDHYCSFIYGNGAYGDTGIECIDGVWSIFRNNSSYEVGWPTLWQDYSITLKNNFGSDASSVAGNIIFNSDILTTVGLSGLPPQTREASTFPHYISGIDGQTVSDYTRKWRNWQNPTDSSIATTLSIVMDYNSLTAKYAKQLNVSIENVFIQNSGGNIILNSTSYPSPLQSIHFYDDEQ